MGVGPLIREGFSLIPTLSGRVLHLVFVGCADAEAQPLLGSYFNRLHVEAMQANVNEVFVDVHELYFINSSCFKAFVTWVATVSAVEPSARYRIRFLKDANLRWQARSFDALHRMSLALVSIEDWAGGSQ